MKLSPNEILILNALQLHKKPMKRLAISIETGISDKNISAKIKSLEIKGLIVTEKTRIGKSTVQIVQLTPAGKKEKLVKIIIKKKPKKEELVKLTKKELAMVQLGKKPINLKIKIRELTGEITKLEHSLDDPDLSKEQIIELKDMIKRREYELTRLKTIRPIELEKPKIPKIPTKIEVIAKPLPATIELKKELRLLINLVLTHRKEEYSKYGYKSVSEIRASIDTLIDQLGG